MVTLMMAVLMLISAGQSTTYRLTGNVALGAETHQSIDLLNKNTASNAVDGNRADESCTSISTKRSPWWSVSLPQTYKIVMISITSANDISGAEIRIGNTLDNHGNYNKLVAKVFSTRPGKTQIFKFSPVKGQFVNVFLPGVNRVLSLCEVEVFARDEESEVTEQMQMNVAVSGRATQSSVSLGLDKCLSLPQNAIDGNRHYELSRGSCAQTDTERDPWWRLDLIKRHTITAVALTNRGDCCSERLNGAVVYIGDSLESEGRANPVCVSVSFIPAGGTGKFRCASALQGRYVTVALKGENRTLSLCEVEVFGVPAQ